MKVAIWDEMALKSMISYSFSSHSSGNLISDEWQLEQFPAASPTQSLEKFLKVGLKSR